MKIIVDHKETKVIYDETKDIYIKKFYPKFKNKIKFFGYKKISWYKFLFYYRGLEKYRYNDSRGHYIFKIQGCN